MLIDAISISGCAACVEARIEGGYLEAHLVFGNRIACLSQSFGCAAYQGVIAWYRHAMVHVANAKDEIDELRSNRE